MPDHLPDRQPRIRLAHEVRGEIAKDSQTTAETTSTGVKVLATVTARLGNDPFPFLLAGAWGQTGRLMTMLDHPSTTQAEKPVIIALLGNMSAVEAFPALSRTLNDKDPALVQSAAVALGAIGQQDSIPLLLEQMKRDSPELRLAAIKGPGGLAPLHPGSQIVPTLLAQLPRESLPVQAEIVRALGNTTDRRIVEPLRRLNRSVQEKTRSDSSPELKELKRTLGESLDQFDGVHTDE